MARMRSIKPEFWLDRKLARRLTRDERMLYIGLWNQADEHARANGDPRVIKGQVFPYDVDITEDVLEVMLKSLADAEVVVPYDVDGDPYLFLPKLAKHQRLEPHKVGSRHPEPPLIEQAQQAIPLPDQDVCAAPEPDPDESAHDPGGAQTSSRTIRAKHVAGSREHVAGGNGADESAPGPAPSKTAGNRGTRLPDDFTVSDEMRSWARELGFTNPQIDSITEAFRDYWRGKPGAAGVKLDWPATWRNWLRRERPPTPPTSGTSGLRPWEL